MAYRKICPECKKVSYSASDLKNWTCSYCGYVVSSDREVAGLKKS